MIHPNPTDPACDDDEPASSVGDAAPEVPKMPGVTPYSRKRPPGGVPNSQISLRIPASWGILLRARAICVAEQEDRVITAQEIVRRIIADALGGQD